MAKNRVLSTSEAAKILGISRIAVFKKIKSGQIKAQKVGRTFVIPENALGSFLTRELNVENRAEIERAVEKTVTEYGETLRLLGEK